MNSKQSLLTLGIVLNTTLFTALPALAQCAFSVTPVNFGPYNVFDTTAKTSTGTITYDCSSANPVPASISIEIDKGNAPSFNPRQLKVGTDILNYNLYRDAGGTLIWGDETNGTQRYTSNNLTGSVTIFGIIPPLQTNVKVGSYTDSLTATLNF
jgi:spore coat protein U-like protein